MDQKDDTCTRYIRSSKVISEGAVGCAPSWATGGGADGCGWVVMAPLYGGAAYRSRNGIVPMIRSHASLISDP